MSAEPSPGAVMAQHARSFAPAARLLGRKSYGRVARLYALCRFLDDLADEDGGPESHARLGRIADELDAGVARDPIVVEAHALFAPRSAGRDALARLVGGVRSDLGPVAVPDIDALEAYADAVAGTVGIMVCDLHRVPDAHYPHATALGRAMQITNICRDVREDAIEGRRYLPGTLCPHSAEAIASATPEVTDDVNRAVAVLLAHAETLYDFGAAGYPALPLRLRLAVAVAASLYRGIGRTISAGGADPMTQRAVVPPARKAGLAIFGLRVALSSHAVQTREARHA